VAIFVIGTEINNARRWIRLGPMSFQPSEFAKLAIVIAAASFAAAKANGLASFRNGFIPACILIAPLAGLILVQPDLGTAVFVGAIGLAVLLVAGLRVRHVGMVAAVALPVVIVGMFLKFGHVQDRILVFMDPEADIRGKGHQIYQSLIAVGSGGFWGKGLGESTQKLFFLPEEHTDFIFAIVVEELGFVGGAFIIMLFAALAYAGARIAKHARDLPGTLITFGITGAIVLQAAMNIAVVTASVPTKGISLPFISFGGTGLVIALAGVGIVINVARQAVSRKQAAEWRMQTWADGESAPARSAPGKSRITSRISVPTAVSARESGALAAVMGDSGAIPRVSRKRKLHLSTSDLDDIAVDPDANYDTDPMPDMKVSIRSNRVVEQPGEFLPTNHSARIEADAGRELESDRMTSASGSFGPS
jgi:cell division protein FtsW